jgi:hypothetical protein
MTSFDDHQFDFLRATASNQPGHSNSSFLKEALALHFISPPDRPPSPPAHPIASTSKALLPPCHIATTPFPMLTTFQQLTDRLLLLQPSATLDPSHFSSTDDLPRPPTTLQNETGDWWDQFEPSPFRTTPVAASYLTLSPVTTSVASTRQPLHKTRYSDIIQSYTNEALGAAMRSIIRETESLVSGNAVANETRTESIYEATMVTRLPVDYTSTNTKAGGGEEEEESIFHQLLRESVVNSAVFSPSTGTATSHIDVLAGGGAAGTEGEADQFIEEDYSMSMLASSPASQYSPGASPLFSSEGSCGSSTSSTFSDSQIKD